LIKITFEGINIDKKNVFEKMLDKIAQGNLDANINHLEEIVLTNNLEYSLSERMIPEEFEEWQKEREVAFYLTGGKTFRSKRNNKNFCSVLLLLSDSNYLEILPKICHEIRHVYWNIYFDKYYENNKLSNLERRKIESLSIFSSEYDACRFEEIINKDINNTSLTQDFNLNDEIKRLIERYNSFSKENTDVFQTILPAILGEFNSIFVRQLGYYDGGGKEELFNAEISRGVINELFDGIMIRITNSIRKFVQTNENSVNEVSELLWNLGSSQTNAFLMNISKYKDS
jgi:hypothetical protein